MKQKLKGYLNLAKKGGFLILGSDELKDYSKKMYLVLVDETAGNNAKKIAARLSEKYQIHALTVKDVGDMIGIPNCKILGLKNKGLSTQIENILLRGEEFD